MHVHYRMTCLKLLLHHCVCFITAGPVTKPLERITSLRWHTPVMESSHSCPSGIFERSCHSRSVCSKDPLLSFVLLSLFSLSVIILVCARMHAWCRPCSHVSTRLWACCSLWVRSRLFTVRFNLMWESRRVCRPVAASEMRSRCLFTTRCHSLGWSVLIFLWLLRFRILSVSSVGSRGCWSILRFVSSEQPGCCLCIWLALQAVFRVAVSSVDLMKFSVRYAMDSSFFDEVLVCATLCDFVSV